MLWWAARRWPGVKALADGVVQITDSSKEYRTILGTLEVSSKQAGYTQEQTTEIYKKFQAVLGDTQKAATATANLQALKLSQEDLTVLMEQAIGAWATYGDSIPIDSLSESINETVQVGKVTGVFADALNWAGTSEDEFNEKLGRLRHDGRPRQSGTVPAVPAGASGNRAGVGQKQSGHRGRQRGAGDDE